MDEDDARPAERPVSGYLGAVAAATLAFILSWVARDPAGAGVKPFQPASLLILGAITLAVALVVAVAAFAPFVAARKLAQHLGITAAWYYALAGGVTGVVLTPLGAVIEYLPEGGATGRFLDTLGNDAPFIIASGIVGGLAYWWIGVRRSVVADDDDAYWSSGA
jgi:hypothetical protein